GVVVDGTGLPRRRADVAITGGRIAEIGYVDGRGARELDVEGRVVAPGIVDPHTHYDPQLTFEPYATSSCYHGVTTVVAGNCGFSVAPLRPGDADWLIQLFSRVEGMDASALAGIPFDGFETFPEYLRSLDGRIGVNAAFYVGHCAVRRYVMGDACQEREATDDEISAMEAIVADAMTHGAAGFSSTHSPTHFDSADRPVPSRLSSTGELERLVAAAGRAAHGGDHPGAGRPFQGGRADRGMGQRQALRRRGDGARRSRVLARHVEALQPHVRSRRRYEAVRRRARVPPHVHRRIDGRGSHRAVARRFVPGLDPSLRRAPEP